MPAIPRSSRAGTGCASASINVYNLLDSRAVTGLFRQGTVQNAGPAYFVCCEILPRRVFLRFTYTY